MGVFSIFGAKKNKEKKPIPTISEYYEKLARKTSYLMLCVLFVFLGFVFFCFTFYSDQLTMENLRYMLKFVDFQTVPIAPNMTEITFDSELSAKASIIRGDIAVADINGLRFYDFNGKRLFSVNRNYSDPLIAYNGKNIIICENQGYEMKIYSAYSEVYTHNFSYPVQALHSNSTGRYLVQTTSQGYKSGVELYDDYFRIIYYHYFVDEYVTTCALSSDGKKIIVGSFISTDLGSFKTFIRVFDADTNEEINLVTYNDELPWAVQFTDNGGFMTLSSGGLRFYTQSGVLLDEENFANRTPMSFIFSEKYAIMVYKNSGLGTTVTVEIHNSSGETVVIRTLPNEISYLKIINTHAYIYTHGELRIIDLTTAADITYQLGDGLIEILYDYENDQIWILNQNGAIIYDREFFNGGQNNERTA